MKNACVCFGLFASFFLSLFCAFNVLDPVCADNFVAQIFGILSTVNPIFHCCFALFAKLCNFAFKAFKRYTRISNCLWNAWNRFFAVEYANAMKKWVHNKFSQEICSCFYFVENFELDKRIGRKFHPYGNFLVIPSVHWTAFKSPLSGLDCNFEKLQL